VISCTDNSFSVDHLQVSTEEDQDLEFTYGYDNGATCKHVASCSKGGSTIQNSQCGGAKSVVVGLPPSAPKETCSFAIHSVGFNCGSASVPVPSSTIVPVVPSHTYPVYSFTIPNNQSTPTVPATAPTNSVSVQTGTAQSSPTYMTYPKITPSVPIGTAPISIPSASSYSVPSNTVPQNSSTTPVVNTPTPSIPASSASTPATDSVSTPSTTENSPTGASSSPTVPGTTVAVYTTVDVTTYVTTCPVTSTITSGSITSTQVSTTVSTFTSTYTSTICTKCVPTPVSSPSSSVATPQVPIPVTGSSNSPEQSTSTLTIPGNSNSPQQSTTPPAAPGSSNSPEQSATAPAAPGITQAVVTTEIQTTYVTTCPVTNTISTSGSISLQTTTTVSTLTSTYTSTICTKCIAPQPSTPAPATPTSTNGNSPVPASSSSPAPSAPCPPVLPQCMNTWIKLTSCENNAASDCYCKDSGFTKSVQDCVSSWAANAMEVQAALSYLAGICAPHVSQNPGIITNVPKTITLVPTPATTPAPVGTQSPASGIVSPAPAPVGTQTPASGPVSPAPSTSYTTSRTTISISQTVTVAATYSTGVSSGSPIPSSSITSILNTAVTVPQVYITSANSGIGASGAPSAGLVAGTPAPAAATPTGPVRNGPPGASTFASVKPVNTPNTSPIAFQGAAGKIGSGMAGLAVAGLLSLVVLV